ncbi:hypothetical protein ACH5RR_007409 [Cinchona calisaya]|uniref:RNase H type-1 domain-containing protein n=1 Tax=Cinchona calisaya TaxID=153742 RepID=A0ABD3ARQ0_9GENT
MDNSPWKRVLHAKYCQDPPISRSRQSHIWRSINNLSEFLMSGVKWCLGNGTQVGFWTDSWIIDDPLCKIVDNILSAYLNRRVNYWWKHSDWNWQVLEELLPQHYQLLLRSFIIIKDSQNEDKLGWKFSNSGKFSVKSAYGRLMENEDPVPTSSIWKGKGPNRANYLIWLVRHDKLMTSNLKLRMNLVQEDACPICQHTSETTIHAIRDCPWAHQALSNDLGRAGQLNWDLTFRTAVNHIWTWRNKAIHSNQYMALADHVRQIKKQVVETQNAITRVPIHNKEEMLLGWEFPRQAWVKLNVDGSAIGCPGSTGGGGLLRNDQGLWIFGFAVNIGKSTSLVAELWAIWKGLEISWDLGLKHLEIESNSLFGVQIIQEATENQQHYSLINHIRELLSRDWECQLSHYWREGNSCADVLAKMSLGLSLGVTLLPEPPDIVKSDLSADVMGATCKRYVKLS